MVQTSKQACTHSPLSSLLSIGSSIKETAVPGAYWGPGVSHVFIFLNDCMKYIILLNHLTGEESENQGDSVNGMPV